MRAIQEAADGLSALAPSFFSAPEMPKLQKRAGAAPAYRIPKRPLAQVHNEILVRQVLRDAEVKRMREECQTLTFGCVPRPYKSGRRVQFRD